MCLQEGDVAVSLGTSDTVFLWLSGRPTPSLEGHVFCNPVDPEAFMALLWYTFHVLTVYNLFNFIFYSFKNGSLTRERIRNVYAHNSWEEFDALLACTPPGNDGHVAMYFDQEEISPRGVQGTFRFDPLGNRMPNGQGFEHAATEVRAIVEGQMLAKRVHAERLGFRIGTKLIVD